MTDDDRQEYPKIVFYLWFDDGDGLRFEAQYAEELITAHGDNAQSIFDSAVLHTVNSFANQLELLNQAYGYSME
jgi:hypothetical protein